MTGTPFKLRVLNALTAALEEIRPANGYINSLEPFDRGDGEMMKRVYRGRMWFGDSDPIPMVSILEGVNPADEVGEPPIAATGGAYDWDLLVQGFVDDNPLNPTDPAYLLLADVRQRLAIERSRKAPESRSRQDPLGLGSGPNRIDSLSFGSGVVRPADDISAKAWFWLNVTLRIVEDAADPYA